MKIEKFDNTSFKFETCYITGHSSGVADTAKKVFPCLFACKANFLCKIDCHEWISLWLVGWLRREASIGRFLWPCEFEHCP